MIARRRAGGYATPDERRPTAESALAHRLIEDGHDPNQWDLFAVWRSGDVFAVVLRCGEGVLAFTAFPDGEGYEVMEVIASSPLA